MGHSNSRSIWKGFISVLHVFKIWCKPKSQIPTGCSLNKNKIPDIPALPNKSYHHIEYNHISTPFCVRLNNNYRPIPKSFHRTRGISHKPWGSRIFSSKLESEIWLCGRCSAGRAQHIIGQNNFSRRIKEGHTNLTNSSNFLWTYILRNVKKVGRFHQTFVAFSEYMNCNALWLH